jgi:exopolyphosphatase / guanosine-5'-triphosphate,3'-diphosphate pyrophosphatase
VKPPPPSSPNTAAIVDIGSNSIKLLVAKREPDGSLLELTQLVRETRLGTGISSSTPRLSEDAMTNAVKDVNELLNSAAAFRPSIVRLVATSAVRDASNGADFVARVKTTTGRPVQVLTGGEEARLIGRGIACEPALRSEAAFYLFDLGGGSLEMLQFIGGRTAQSVSVQLGCVRVTEACVADPTKPFTADDAEKVGAHVRKRIAASNFRFDLPPPTPAVITGGSATTLRTMRGAAWGRALAVESPILAVTELKRFMARVGELSLEERRRLPGLPASRADVMPAAICTFLELAQLAGVDALRHSFYSLRYGVADEILER